MTFAAVYLVVGVVTGLVATRLTYADDLKRSSYIEGDKFYAAYMGAACGFLWPMAIAFFAGFWICRLALVGTR